MHIKFKKSGITKEVKVGFSWTIFFFGWIALAIRGQYVAAFISFITLNIAACYYMFAANRLLARKLVADGWVSLEELPAQWGIEQ